MKFLIIANGPFLAKDALLKASNGKTILALDGAVDKLVAMGITPNIVLGDFDSIRDKKVYANDHLIKVVFKPDQNANDLQKAIAYAREHGANEIDILCATGGRMDHTLRNIRALRDLSPEYFSITMRLHTESETLEYVRDKKIILRGKKDDYCGIFAFPHGSFTSSGLKYNGKNFPLEFGVSEGSSNQFAEEIVEIVVTGEALVVYPSA